MNGFYQHFTESLRRSALKLDGSRIICPSSYWPLLCVAGVTVQARPGFDRAAALALTVTPTTFTTIAGEEGHAAPDPDHGMRSLWSGLGIPAPSR